MSDVTSMVMESSENGTDASQEDNDDMGEANDDIILSRLTSVSLVPFIGQRFVSQDAAYEFYCCFAKQCGFAIRRHRTRGKDGVGRGVTRRDFTCHRGGYPQNKPAEDNKMKRNRKSLRCGCQAYMRIVRRADFDVPEWCVTGFRNIHNHELITSNEVHLLPAYCTITPDDKSRICMFAKAGMSVKQMLRLMELEKGVKLGCLPFTEMDIRNLLQSFGNFCQDIDAIDLISMCKKLKDEDHNFKYDFKLDGNNRLENIAWSYASSIQLYEAFGDAVVFDTTHRLDAYDMLLGIWIGLDNHGMTCFFGCVLLRDENTQSFSWALKAFVQFMNGKAPKTILTDQNMWLKEAVAIEIPDTKHAFCIWHIIAKFSVWFSMLLGSCYDDWKSDFLRLYNLESVEDFEEGWNGMVDKYGLHSNKHMAGLYKLRSFWALPFLRRYFFAGMTNISQSESINAFIQRFLSAQSQLECFVERVADILLCNDERKRVTQRKLNKIHLKTGSPIESHAAVALTPYAFNKLQEELVLAPQYATFPVDEFCVQVRHHTQINGGCKVTWNPCEEQISCSCKRFEFSGILCRHVLRVLSTNNCFQIPDEYLPTRWRFVSSCATTRVHSERLELLEALSSTLVSESMETEERLDVACEQIAMALSRVKDLPRQTHGYNPYTCPSESLILQEMEDGDRMDQTFTSGNPHEPITPGKERRTKDGADITRKKRHCSGPCCGQLGHDPSNCPIMGSDHLNGIGIGYL